MESLAAQVWNPWLAMAALGVGGVLLLATLVIPLRGLPRAFASLRGGAVSDGSSSGGLWLPLATATGMGGVTGGALAVASGGPGALIWLWVATLGGMAVAFAEGSLGARAVDDREPGAVHLLAAPSAGRLLAPMYTLAVLAMALVVGAAFQTHQAGAVLEATVGLTPQTVAIGLALAAAPLVLLPQLRRPLFMLVPLALALYAIAAFAVLGDSEGPMLSLMLGDAINEAFGITPAAGGAAGGVVSLAITHGVLRATLAGEAGLGTAALADLRARSRGAAGAVAMLVPLVASGVLGGLSGMLMLGGPVAGAAVADPELVPLERAHKRGLRPSQQAGQTIVLPDDTTLEAGKHYAMRLRSNPRGHAMARLVPDQNHVAMPHWQIAESVDTIIFHARAGERSEHASWDVRIPAEREIKQTPEGLEYLLLHPKDDSIDLKKLSVQLDLLGQPYVNVGDFDFIGRVGRATSPDQSLGEHLAMFEPKHADRPFNPKLHEFFRGGFFGPIFADDQPRPPFAFAAREGFTPEIGTTIELRLVGNPRGDAVLNVTRSGSLEAPPWDLAMEAREVVLRHAHDPTKDIRLAVTPRYDRYRVRFDLADKRYEDMRLVKEMKDYSGPFLAIPDLEFKAEVHGDTRLPEDLKGRRTLIPLHPLGEVQGPYGDTELYTPHPGELIAMGVAGPVLSQEGVERLATRLAAGLGGNGRPLVVLAVLIFALSTLVGWAELAGRAATAIVGPLGGPVFKAAMLIAAAVGTRWTLDQLLPVVDLTIAAVAVPSLVGLLLLLPAIRRAARFEDDLGSDKTEPEPPPSA